MQLRKDMAVNVSRLLITNARGRQQQQIAVEAWPGLTLAAAQKEIQRIKNGTVWPSDYALEGLARALGVPARALFDKPIE